MEPADVPNQKVADIGCAMTLILTHGADGLTLGLRVQLVDSLASDNSFSHAIADTSTMTGEMMASTGLSQEQGPPRDPPLLL